MELSEITNAIDIVLERATTPENVAELASLYICKSNLENGLNRQINAPERELQDILPYYGKYIDIKRRYQLNQTNESEVIQGIKDVCREITEFIAALYSGTDMNKERICIRQMIDVIHDKYSI